MPAAHFGRGVFTSDRVSTDSRPSLKGWMVQDEEEWDWGQLAPRVFQAFSGAGNGLSASEKAGVERAANAKPWVHMVRRDPPGMHQNIAHLRGHNLIFTGMHRGQSDLGHC